MMTPPLNQTAFAVRINGKTIKTLPSRQMAEAAVLTLPPDQQQLAEIAVVQQSSGKDLLLG